MGQVNTITLNLAVNLRDSQRNDPHLAYIIDMKTRKQAKPDLKELNDAVLKSWLKNYDKYFLHDEIFYRAIGDRRNPHPQHVILIPSSMHANILKTLHDAH